MVVVTCKIHIVDISTYPLPYGTNVKQLLQFRKQDVRTYAYHVQHLSYSSRTVCKNNMW